ncbi:MAG: PIN/TRAM domain-containing protein [Planctomycetota bacterium]
MAEVYDRREGGAGEAGETRAPKEETDAAGEGPAAPERARPASRRLRRPGLTKPIQDRLTLLVVRFVFFLTAGGLGLYGVQVFAAVTMRTDLDPGLGVLAGCLTALVLIALEVFFARSPIRTLSAITFGLIIGLVLSIFFRFVVDFVAEAVAPASLRGRSNFPLLLSYLQIVTTAIFCYFGVTILLQTKDDFKFIIPYVEFRKEPRSQTPLVLDTSSFVDGRILALLETGVFEDRLVVPAFVLKELQTVADSADKSLRERGRRGLDILHEIERSRSIEFVEHSLRKGETVDDGLLAVAADYGGRVLTTDYNLQKAAKLRGIPLINVNDLAAALKPAFVPGEILSVRLLREGDEKGQGVGFLADGTMVVVENARQRIGQAVTVEVTSSLQTSAGKMVFGKLARPAKPPPPS